MMYKKLLLIAALISWQVNQASKEYTLAELEDLASHYQEDIQPGNDDPVDPNFTSYLVAQRPSIFTRVARMFGAFPDPFHVKDFIATMRSVVAEQRQRFRTKDYIMGMRASLEDTIVVLGNIQGSFHSLVRSLQELERQGIIDRNLKVVNKNHKIIFNGTVAGKAPLILQTLFVITLLMKQNPEQVFYLESEFEKDKLWRDRNFTDQIDILYKRYRRQIYKLFEDFTDISPFVIYFGFSEQPEQVLKLTALSDFEADTIENKTGSFFKNLKTDSWSVWPLHQSVPSTMRVYTGALVEGIMPSLKTAAIEPLMFLESIGEASRWNIFSAPTYSSRKLYDFHDDACVKIVCGTSINSTIIELYARNVMKQKPFALRQSFNIDTGSPRTVTRENLLKAPEKIYLGTTLDLSKSDHNAGESVRTGITVAARDVNTLGGVKHKEVQPIILDDEYDPQRALRNITSLRNEYKVDTLLLPTGAGIILAAQDLMKAHDILVAFPVTGISSLRGKDLKGVVNYRAPFSHEIDALLHYLIHESKLKNYAFFYQDDEYGVDCMTKAREVLKQNGIEKWTEIPYQRNNTSFDKQKDILKNSSVQALGCFSTSIAAKEFLKQVGVESLSSIKVFGVSSCIDDVFESFLKDGLGLTCLFSRVVPNPTWSTFPIVQEYRVRMNERKIPYDDYSLEAYLCTRLLCDILEKGNGDNGHKVITQQLEALKDYEFGGLTFTFDPQTRQISDRVWLDFQDGQDWKEIT